MSMLVDNDVNSDQTMHIRKHLGNVCVREWGILLIHYQKREKKLGKTITICKGKCKCIVPYVVSTLCFHLSLYN